MSETKSTQDWMQDWQALQGQYWNAWSDTTRANVVSPPATTPWHEGLEQWSRLFGESGKQSDTFDRLLSGAKGYVGLMQSMLAAAAGQSAGEGAPKDWSAALRDGFSLGGADASLLNNPLAKMLRDISGPGAQGFEQLSASFAPFLAQAKQERQSWLSLPAFGYKREQQEHYQKMAMAYVDFQDAVRRYNALILKSSQRSFVIFEDKLTERSEPGRQIGSLRALYDLWVDAAEEAYAEIALSDEFRQVYGDVVNAQMRVRAQIQQQVEHIGADLGMPTRSELNSVHQRLHELRRGAHARSDNAGAAMRAELTQLRAEVDALKRGQRAPVTPAAAKPKAVKSKAAKPQAAKPARNKAVKTSKARK